MPKLSAKYQTGHEATEAIREFFLRRALPTGLVSTMVQFLQDRNFVVSPRPYQRPARRGMGAKRKASAPVKYTGPDMIGQSHVSRILGG